MAYLTLDTLRTQYLNLELGLPSDLDTKSFGDQGARNYYICNAIRKLWPEVAKLTSETFVTLANTQLYSLATVEDVERLEILVDGDPDLVGETIRSWQVVRDESTDPPTVNLLIPRVASGQTVRVIGYAPYAIPAIGSSEVDFPSRMAHVVIAGARVEAFRTKVTTFLNFAQFANENRANVVTPPELLDLLRQAEREWQSGKASIARSFSAPRRARTQTR